MPPAKTKLRRAISNGAALSRPHSASRSMLRCRRSARPAASRLATASGCAPQCWSKLSLIEPPYCARLGIPFAYDPGPGLLSMEAIANPPAYDRARAAVRYDDVARALVHAYKYGDRLDLAPILAGWMARAGRELLADADALIPVPLHWRRLWARRFNQSATLAARYRQQRRCPGAARCAQARARHRASGRPVEGAARRECAGRVPRAGRREGATSQAAASSLIDDVLTSGVTADTCARALLRAGAKAGRCAGFCAGCESGTRSHIKNRQFNPLAAMQPVEIYTTRFCPYCVAAKALAQAQRRDVQGDRRRLRLGPP